MHSLTESLHSLTVTCPSAVLPVSLRQYQPTCVTSIGFIWPVRVCVRTQKRGLYIGNRRSAHTPLTPKQKGEFLNLFRHTCSVARYNCKVNHKFQWVLKVFHMFIQAFIRKGEEPSIQPDLVKGVELKW